MRVVHAAGLTLFSVAVLSGCPRPGVSGRPPSPPVKVPPGCEANLSGTYVHAERPDWRYVGTDDGGTLVLAVERALEAEADAGTSLPAFDGGARAGEDVAVILERTPDGFVGAARATVYTPSRPCEVSFPTELVACTDGGLTLSSAEALMVDEATCAVRQDPSAPRKEHRLVPFTPVEPGADGGS